MAKKDYLKQIKIVIIYEIASPEDRLRPQELI